MKNSRLLFLLLYLSFIAVPLFGQNRCLNFDGVQDYVDFNSLTDDFVGLPDFTVEFYLRAGLIQSNVRVALFAINKDGQFNNRFLIVLGGESTQTGEIIVYDDNTGAGGFEILADVMAADMEWHHIAYRKQGTLGELFVDGQFVGNHTANFEVGPDDRISLAQEYDGNNTSDFFRGDLDQLRIWEGARTDAQIVAGMQTEFMAGTPGLIAEYTFNQGIPAGNNAGETTLEGVGTTGNNGILESFALNGHFSNWICSDVFGLTQSFLELGLEDVVSADCNEEITLDAGDGLYEPTFSWSNGATTASIEVEDSGWYSVTATSQGCLYYDSTLVELTGSPTLNLGPDTCVTDSYQLSVSLADGDEFIWQDGSTGENFIVSESGVYFGTLTNVCGVVSDSVEVSFEEYSINLGNDTVFCNADMLQLSAEIGASDANYLWSDGSMSSTISVTEPGSFGVTVTDGICVYTDEILIEQVISPVVDLGEDFCSPEAIVLSIEAESGTDIQWQDGSSLSEYLVSESGVYSVTLTNVCGSAIDSIEIAINDLGLELGSDILLCPGDSVVLTAANTANNPAYSWTNGSTESTIVVSESGVYEVTLTADGCSLTDSVIVEFIASLSVALPETLEFCEDEAGIGVTVLQDQPADYSWSTGDTTAQVFLSDEGTYVVTVSGICETIVQETVVAHVASPMEPDIPTEQSICTGEQILLDASVPQNLSYLWQDGTSNPVFVATIPGTYSVTLSNICGSVVQEVEISSGDCCELTVPNIFTPNGDGLNDRFAPVGLCADGTDYRFEVYNRWGQLVFESSDLEEAWDGRIGNRPAPFDVYVWQLHLTTPVRGTLVESGDVTLAR